MDMRPGLVRRAHQTERLTPSPIILPAEAIAVTLLILVVALGLTIRSEITSAAHNDGAHAGCGLNARQQSGDRVCVNCPFRSSVEWSSGGLEKLANHDAAYVQWVSHEESHQTSRSLAASRRRG
jgi:hypothetical protein